MDSKKIKVDSSLIYDALNCFALTHDAMANSMGPIGGIETPEQIRRDLHLRYALKCRAIMGEITDYPHVYIVCLGSDADGSP